EKSSGDDERLIGYLRAISAKSVVQSLKESEKAAEAEEEGQPLLGTQRAQRRCFPYDTGELSARDDFGLGLSRFADVDDSSGFLRLGSAGEVVGLLIWVSRQGLDSCTFRRYGAKTERSKTERSSSSRRQGSKCTTATGVQVGSLREQAGRRGHFGMSTMQCYFTLSLQLLGKESLARPSKRFDDPTAAMQARPLCARCERLAQRGVLMLEKFAWTEEAEKACRSGAFKDAVQQFGNAAEDLSFLGRPSVREHPADMPEEASENEMGEDESLQESDAAPRASRMTWHDLATPARDVGVRA
ncbi:unnamed protein product, partial [Symbiodinium microadriaticum]